MVSVWTLDEVLVLVLVLVSVVLLPRLAVCRRCIWCCVFVLLAARFVLTLQMDLHSQCVAISVQHIVQHNVLHTVIYDQTK